MSDPVIHARVVNLACRGWPAASIEHLTGAPAVSVNRAIHGRRIKPAGLGSVRVRLPFVALDLVEKAAARRGVSAEDLLRRLVEVACAGGRGGESMIDEILDDVAP